MTEKITVNSKEYTIKLLFGDEIVSNDDFCIGPISDQWRTCTFVRGNQDNLTAKRFLVQHGFKKVGKLIKKKNIG